MLAKLQAAIQAVDPNGKVLAIRRANQWDLWYITQDDQHNGGVYKYTIAIHGKVLAMNTIADYYSGVHCSAEDQWDIIDESGIVSILVTNS